MAFDPSQPRDTEGKWKRTIIKGAKELGAEGFKGAKVGAKAGGVAAGTIGTTLLLGGLGHAAARLISKGISRGFPGLISKIFF